MDLKDYDEIMGSEIVEPLKLTSTNVKLSYADDYAINMAFRIITTQVFTQYSIHTEKNISKSKLKQIEDLLDKSMQDLKLALLDYLIYGKAILYQLKRINPQGTIIRTNGKGDYYIEYEGLIESDVWWKEDPKTVKVIIAPKELHETIKAEEKEVYLLDAKYVSVFTNPIPSENTIKNILEIKNSLLFTIMPMMAQRSLIPCLLGKASSKKSLEILKKALKEWYNNTRILVPDEASIEVISMGKDINVDLLELMLYTYDSALFMALGTSISTVKASGQELTTSRTIDRNLLRIITGYQQEVERWIYEQLQKMGFDGVWVKFETPDAGDKEIELERVRTVAQLKQLEAQTGQDMSEYINRIFPKNEYGEILAAFPDLTEQEVEKLLKMAMEGKEGLDYVKDEYKKKELEEKREKLKKVMEYLHKKADDFGKKSIREFIRYLIENNGHVDDYSLDIFTAEQVDKFILDYLAPTLNYLGVYDYIDGEILNDLRELWRKAFKNIYSSYSQQAIDVISEGIRRGWGEEKIAKELKKAVKDIEGRRLQLRAREELVKTYNFGRAKKYWNRKVMYVTMKDERVRPSHRKLHGLIFVPAKRPELVPPLGYGCRCTITPVRD